jgi:hypothetical protein
MSGYKLDNLMTSVLGGGLPGAQAKGGLLGGGAGPDGGSGMTGGGERSIDRKVLRQAFGNSAKALTNLPGGVSPLTLANNGGSISGLFRNALSAGDPLGTHNKAANSKYGPVSNQVNGVNGISSLGGYKSLADGIRSDGVAAYSGNPRYVYDSSDYIRFKKLMAKNRTYNDSSFGGGNNASQSAIRQHY